MHIDWFGWSFLKGWGSVSHTSDKTRAPKTKKLGKKEFRNCPAWWIQGITLVLALRPRPWSNGKCSPLQRKLYYYYFIDKYFWTLIFYKTQLTPKIPSPSNNFLSFQINSSDIRKILINLVYSVNFRQLFKWKTVSRSLIYSTIILFYIYANPCSRFLSGWCESFSI